MRAEFSRPAHGSINVVHLEMRQSAFALRFALPTLIDGNDSEMLREPAQHSGMGTLVMTAPETVRHDDCSVTRAALCRINAHTVRSAQDRLAIGV